MIMQWSQYFKPVVVPQTTVTLALTLYLCVSECKGDAGFNICCGRLRRPDPDTLLHIPPAAWKRQQLGRLRQALRRGSIDSYLSARSAVLVRGCSNWCRGRTPGSVFGEREKNSLQADLIIKHQSNEKAGTTAHVPVYSTSATKYGEIRGSRKSLVGMYVLRHIPTTGIRA